MQPVCISRSSQAFEVVFSAFENDGVSHMQHACPCMTEVPRLYALSPPEPCIGSKRNYIQFQYEHMYVHA